MEPNQTHKVFLDVTCVGRGREPHVTQEGDDRAAQQYLLHCGQPLHRRVVHLKGITHCRSCSRMDELGDELEGLHGARPPLGGRPHVDGRVHRRRTLEARPKE